MCKEKEYAEILLNADAVARARGDRFGLCDCIDKNGNPYPSAWLEGLLEEARNILKLASTIIREINPKWSTSKHWEKYGSSN
jgi:hypothetical protein